VRLLMNECRGIAEMSALTLSDSWWDGAACRTAEPELFFPISLVAGASAHIERAKLVCASCPVRPQCLNYALNHRQEQGIWGGLTDEERRLLRRRTAASNRRAFASADRR
jgi:WhiB family transcriptional regulator, redox-sensing transcriptional regulator